MIKASILSDCRKGKRKAFKVFYEASVAYVFTIVSRYIHDASSHKDLVQEAYAQIFTSLDKYDERKGEIKPYIRKIAVNCCLMHLRKTKCLPVITPLEDGEIVELVVENPTVDQLSQGDIKKLLVDMPAGYKTVFCLHTLDDYSHKEISKLLGVSQSTVRTQYLRAKNWIKNSSILDVKKASYGIS